AAILAAAGVADAFDAIVSGESPQVARGKPAPDIYVEASRLLALRPAECIAIEDSENGVRSAHLAGCYVVALPGIETASQDFTMAQKVLGGLSEFDFDLLGREWTI
ncbi:MAG: HAD-IA family hydrolase, partial [Planctomycetota bacterium]|nr:HAD-IA family hydrolase [Planctomycetota bacterium]